MPSILPPAPEKQDEDSLSVLHELAPPCEYSAHKKLSSEPAAWIVWFRDTVPCSCPFWPVQTYCDPCWTWRNRFGKTVCGCGISRIASVDVMRAERI